MGKMERKVKISKVQEIILESFKVAGVLSAAVLAPNVLWSMKKLGLQLHKRQIESIKRSQQSLVNRGLLKISGEHVSITSKGRAYLNKCLALGEAHKLNINKKWDKRWRILIFDIPETRRYDRDNIRHSLISMGFLKLQNSVWVFPYDCENIVSLLKADAEIGDNMLYIIANSIENEEEIKKYFNL